MIDRKIKGLDVDTVCGDSYRGAIKLINDLIKKGYKKIAMITASLHLSTSQERLAGYKQALRDNGLEIIDQFIKIDKNNDGYSREGGYNLTRELLGGKQYPDAIFTGNNFMALGAYKAIREVGLDVPDDIAVVCFDDLHLTYEVDPFFTAAVQPAYTMGKMAAGLLINKIEGEYEGNVQQIVLQPELKIRKSC